MEDAIENIAGFVGIMLGLMLVGPVAVKLISQ